MKQNQRQAIEVVVVAAAAATAFCRPVATTIRFNPKL
jgi:hypothetical protein